MSLLSLDSSFQNPAQNRHGSLANITSSIHSSPKSNRNTLKPNSNSKSIEKPPNNRNNSSTKKAPLAKTPQKYTNRDNFSPIPLSKRSIPRNDANPDFKRSYDPSTNRTAAPLPRDPTLKRSSSKPLANISMCSSRVSSNLTHSDLRQSTFDKLNESIEALAKSALAESLYHAKEMPPRGSQSSSRKPAPTKSREPEVSSFSASGSKNQTLNMSGSKRNIMNSQNTSFVMQKVYSVNNKALNLTNLLTRPRSREDLSSRHPVLTSASRKDVKENEPKFTPIRQSLDHSSSSSSKLNMQKRLSEPAVKSKGLEVRNLNTSNIQETPYIPSSLVKSLIGGHNTSTNLGDITKITEKDESSHFCIGDKTVSFGDCNQTLSHYIKTEEKDDNDHELALNSLKERFDVFVGTISTVLDEAAFREKRSFFIKLLTMVHAHKVKLSKFLASQEQNKKAFYFGLWNQALGQQSQHDFTQTSMICEKEAGIDQMLEEAQLSTAISFHSNKLLKKYFYQGFLGHYVVCKLGPEEQELLPEPIIKHDSNNKRSKSPSMRPSPTTPQDKRKSFPTTNQRSKTPTNSQSLNIANFNLKPTSTRKFTPTDRSFRSQTCLTSPNQSFIKGTKYPPKGSKGTKEIMSASVLDQSFGCENPKTLLTEELIPDQILTKIPQPQKKEGLETLRFDTPRRMNTRNNTLESTERSLKSSTTTTGSNIKSRIPSQNRFGNSPSCQQQSQKKKPQEKIPEKKEFTKVLKKKYEPSRRETETTPPPLRQKPRSNSNLKRTEEKTVSSFTKTKGTRASYEEDDFFEVSEYNEQKALAFRKKKLTQLYGQKFLTILVTTTNRKIQAAWFLRIRNLLRKGLLGLLEAVECQDTQKSIEEIKEEEHSEDNSEEEEDEEESENMKMMMNIAKEHYETNVKINVFNNLLEYFVQSHEEGKVYAQYRDNSLKRSCFSKWFEVLPKLKEEDEKFEHAYEAIIQKFRFIMLTEKALRQWRNYIAEGGKDQSDE